jgi:3-oxoacyl-[acyl-carrier protein] reductase
VNNPDQKTAFDLSGKVAIVTGAARGIGFAIASVLGEAGAKVRLIDIDEPAVTAAAASIPGAKPIAFDITDTAAVNQAVQGVRDELGRIDILVNNAGIDSQAPVTELTDADWDRMIAVNLTATFAFTRAVTPTMTEQGTGRIINIGSNLAALGSAGFSHYCASKGGVLSFTKAIARELAPYGVTANVIAPGPVQTEMLDSLPREAVNAKLEEVPLARPADPRAEIAPTALLLASAAGAYYTGSTLNVSGGDVMA